VTFEPTTRKIITIPDSMWERVTNIQVNETARNRKVVSQSDVIRRALAIGLATLERDSDLDAT